jgi:hypothetical protein
MNSFGTRLLIETLRAIAEHVATNAEFDQKDRSIIAFKCFVVEQADALVPRVSPRGQ